MSGGGRTDGAGAGAGGWSLREEKFRARLSRAEAGRKLSEPEFPSFDLIMQALGGGDKRDRRGSEGKLLRCESDPSSADNGSVDDASSEDERCVEDFPGGDDDVRGLAYARVGDKSLLLSGGDWGGSLWVRDARDPGGAARELAGHRSSVTSVVAAGRGAGGTADNVLAASCSWDGTVRLWGCENATAKGELCSLQMLETSNGDWLECVDLTPDASRVVAGGTSKSVHVWTRRSAGAAAAAPGDDAYAAVALSGHTKPVRAVQVSRTGERVVSASWDGTVRVWHVAMVAADGPSHKLVSWNDDDCEKLRSPSSLALAADGQTAYVADWGRSDIALVDCESAREVAALRSGSVESGVWSLALLESSGSGASGRLFSGHRNGVIGEWDLAARTCSAVYGDPHNYTGQVLCMTARFLEEASDGGDAVACSESARAGPRVTSAAAGTGSGRDDNGALSGAGQNRVELAARHFGGAVRVRRTSSEHVSGKNSAAEAVAGVDDREIRDSLLGGSLIALCDSSRRGAVPAEGAANQVERQNIECPPSSASLKANNVEPGKDSCEAGAEGLDGGFVEEKEAGGEFGMDEEVVLDGLEEVRSMPTLNVGRTERGWEEGEESGNRGSSGEDSSLEKSCAWEDGGSARLGVMYQRADDASQDDCAQASELPKRAVKSLHGRSYTTSAEHSEKVDGVCKLSTIAGSETESPAARQPIDDIIGMPGLSSSAGGGCGGDAGGGGGGSKEGSCVDNDSGGESTAAGGVRDLMTRIIQVPNACVDRVIGPNGDTIRDLQTRSGATINVAADTDARPDAALRRILISGNARAIRSAETRVNTVVQDFVSPRCALVNGSVATDSSGGVDNRVGSLDGSGNAGRPVYAAGDPVGLGKYGNGIMASRISGEAHAGGYSTLKTEVLAVQKFCVEDTAIRDPLEGSVTFNQVDTELDVSHSSLSRPSMLFGSCSSIDTSRKIIADKLAGFRHRWPAVRLGLHLAAAGWGYAPLIHISPSVRSHTATPTEMAYTPSTPVSYMYTDNLIDNTAYFRYTATYEGTELQSPISVQQIEHQIVRNQHCGFPVHGYETQPGVVCRSHERFQQHRHQQHQQEHQRQHQQKLQKQQHRQSLQLGQNQQDQQHQQQQQQQQQQLVLLPSTAKPRGIVFPGHRNGACDITGPEGTCILWSLSEILGLLWEEDFPRATRMCRAFAKWIELPPPRELWHEPRSVVRDSAKAFDQFQRSLDGRGKCAACFLVLVSDTDKIVLNDMSEACEAFWCALDVVKRLATELESRWSSARFLGFVFFGNKVPPRRLSWPDARGLWFGGEHPPHGCSSSTATPERNSCECGPPAILCIDDGDAIQPQGSAWSSTGATRSSSGEDQSDELTRNGLSESGDGTGSSSGEDRNDSSVRNGLPESGYERVGNEGDKEAGEEQRKKRRKWAMQKREQRTKLRQDPLKLAASRERDRDRKRDAALRKVVGEVIDNVCSRKLARKKPPDRESPQSHDQGVHHPHGSHLQEEVVSSEQELEQPREIAQPKRLDYISVETPEQRKIADLERENEQLLQEIRHLRQENNQVREEKNQLRQENNQVRQETNQVRQENTDLRKDNERKGLTLSTLFRALADVMKGADLWKTICPLFNREEVLGLSRASSNPRFSGTVGGSRRDPGAQDITSAIHPESGFQRWIPDPSPRTPETGANAFESGAAIAGALSAGGYNCSVSVAIPPHNPAACRNENFGYARLGPERSSSLLQDESQGAALNPPDSTATTRATHIQAPDPQFGAPNHSAGRPSAAPSLDWGYGGHVEGSAHALPQDRTPTLHQLPMIPQASQITFDAIVAPLSTPEFIPPAAPVEAFWRQRWSKPLLSPRDLESPHDDDNDDDDDDDYGDDEDIFPRRFPQY